ncbi:MAG: hypothetical protein O2800_04175 [Planctomycetota bacterium]|nr:hypothetical protein [Planctomycetota bacterium]
MPLNKCQLIDAIKEFNASADRAWLGLFSITELGRYLDHLQHAEQPRGESVWKRDNECNAVLFRHAA